MPWKEEYYSKKKDYPYYWVKKQVKILKLNLTVILLCIGKDNLEVDNNWGISLVVGND